jgi:hypothetical protein
VFETVTVAHPLFLLQVTPGRSAADVLHRNCFAERQDVRESPPRPISLIGTGPLRVASCSLDSETFVWSLPNLIRLMFYSDEPFLFLALVGSALTLVLRDEQYVSCSWFCAAFSQ